MTVKTREKIDLQQFLEGLAEPARAEARAAAGKIEELDRTAQQVAEIERRFLPWAVGAALAFVIGAVLVFSDGDTFRQARDLLGFVPLAAMLAAFPIVAIAYGLKVRYRTRADREVWQLNQTYFVPHGGIYFPPGEAKGGVYLTGPIEKQAKDWRDDKYRAGRIW